MKDAELHEQLSHPNPWVVGYCFECLLARRSLLLAHLPATLKSRSESVHRGFTCMIVSMPLHQYVTTSLKHDMNLEPTFAETKQ